MPQWHMVERRAVTAMDWIGTCQVMTGPIDLLQWGHSRHGWTRVSHRHGARSS
jgi:hypothetical protein